MTNFKYFSAMDNLLEGQQIKIKQTPNIDIEEYHSNFGINDLWI